MCSNKSRRFSNALKEPDGINLWRWISMVIDRCVYQTPLFYILNSTGTREGIIKCFLSVAWCLPEGKYSPYDLHKREPDTGRDELKHEIILTRLIRAYHAENMHTRNHSDDVTTCKDGVDFLNWVKQHGRVKREKEIPTLNCVPNILRSSLIPETYALATLERSRSNEVFSDWIRGRRYEIVTIGKILHIYQVSS